MDSLMIIFAPISLTLSKAQMIGNFGNGEDSPCGNPMFECRYSHEFKAMMCYDTHKSEYACCYNTHSFSRYLTHFSILT